MGYGLGIFLLAVGLILAFAVTDNIADIDLTMVGYILAAVGVLAIALTAFTASSRSRASAVTTHPDGSQTVQRRNEPPAV